MSIRFRLFFANFTSIVMTLSLVIAVGVFIFFQRDTFTVFSPANTLSQATDNMAKSERIDEKQVENELNKIANEKRKKEDARVAEEKRKKAVEEKARKEKIAQEEAKKKEVKRVRLEKEAKIKKEKEEQLRKENKLKVEKEKVEAQKKRDDEAKQKEVEERQKKEAAEKAETVEKERQAKIAAENEAKIDAAFSASYINQVHGYLHSMWQPTIVNEGLSTTVTISVNQNGEVQGTPKIDKQSGNFAFDDSVIIAILSASPLPMPDEPLARVRLARDGFKVTFTPTQASEESF